MRQLSGPSGKSVDGKLADWLGPAGEVLNALSFIEFQPS